MTTVQTEKHFSFLEQEVNRHYVKFTDKKNIKLFIGTWNVNAKAPKRDITSWIFPANEANNCDIDVYVLGFQEIVDLNAANLWIENDANLAWEKAIEECFASENEFFRLAERHLVGILLLVYVRSSVMPFVNKVNVQTAHCGVGLFGSAGNKGGVGVRMQLYDSWICFICAHLAAHKNNKQGRNQDYNKIINNLKFQSLNNESINNNNNAMNHSTGDNGGNTSSMLSENSNLNEEILYDEWGILDDNDMVFWLGDLNYRLDMDNIEQVFMLVSAGDYKQLLCNDQLLDQKERNLAFSGFVEHEILFRPTYKFQPGTSEYERRAEKKARFPAWCDRILWRNGNTRTTSVDDVVCVAYNVDNEQEMSDHKPVYGVFEYACNMFDLARKKKVKESIMKKMDVSDNQRHPQIEIESEVSFPYIKFGALAVQDFVIHNTGQVNVSFRFTLHNESSFPPWLSISPDSDMILCGEKKTVKFEISITSADVVRNYIPANNRLEMTCLLKIENLNTYASTEVPTKFVIVTANYLQSCFANRIETLVKYKKPIRYIADTHTHTHRSGGGGGGLASLSSTAMATTSSKTGASPGSGMGSSASNSVEKDVLSIPKELWRLIDYIYKYGMSVEKIFIRPGVLEQVMKVRECLDTGKIFGKVELLSVGQCLVLWLEKLQEPVFPLSLCESFNMNDNLDIHQWCRSALMALPLSHYNSFIYCVSFLREILKHTSKNKLTSEQLAFCFSSALMQSSMKNVSDLNKHKPFRIMLYFLRNDLFLT